MENNLDVIEDIQKNKIFYIVVLENHMRHLQKSDTALKGKVLSLCVSL